jgi:hypothetical protein
MRRNRCLATAGLVVGLADRTAVAQTPPADPTWSFSASAYTYFLPEEENYAVPVVTADHDGLHLEARYNYEDRGTASVWAGYSLNCGATVAFELTPMLGVVFGDTDGLAPGYRASLTWRQLDVYTEGEYLFDSGDSADDFFYSWSEFAWVPAESWRLGLVVQRTRAYESDFEVERGVFAGGSYRSLDFTGYLFSPGSSGWTAVLAVGVNF